MSKKELTLGGQQRKLSQQRKAKQAIENLLLNPALRRDNLGELYARAFFQEALHGIMDIARDPEVDPDVRRKAYLDVAHIAYGKPASVLRVPGDAQQNPIIDGEIEKAGAAAQGLSVLQHYAHLPPEEWPEDVRKAVDSQSDPESDTDVT